MGKGKNLGYFKTILEASAAYKKAKVAEIIRVSKTHPSIENYIAQHADLYKEPV